MSRHEHEKLLQEILESDEPANFRESSLQLGLQAMAQNRRRRRIARTGMLALLPLLLVLWTVANRGSKREIFFPPVIAETAEGAPTITTEMSEEKIKFINDEELFALFPDRPMALIGEPGQQQLVFLDHRPANAVSPN